MISRVFVWIYLSNTKWIYLIYGNSPLHEICTNEIVGYSTFKYESQLNYSVNGEESFFNTLTLQYILNDLQNGTDEVKTLNALVYFTSFSQNSPIQPGHVYTSKLTSNTLEIKNGSYEIAVQPDGMRIVKLSFELC